MRILIATDGSEFSKAAVERACAIAKGLDSASIRVISVYEPQPPAAAEPYLVSGEYFAMLNEAAKERADRSAGDALELIRQECDGGKVDVSSVVELGKPARMIVEAAASCEADLIVMGSHGHGFWGRLALGSVSDAVLHQAPCSVLIVKGPRK